MRAKVEASKGKKSKIKLTNDGNPHGRLFRLLLLVRRLGLAHALLDALGVLLVGASLGRGLSLGDLSTTVEK
jgi:hypothetical protein